MVRYSFLVRLSHPLLHAGLSRRLLDYFVSPEENDKLHGKHSLPCPVVVNGAEVMALMAETFGNYRLPLELMIRGRVLH